MCVVEIQNLIAWINAALIAVEHKQKHTRRITLTEKIQILSSAKAFEINLSNAMELSAPPETQVVPTWMDVM